MSNSERVTERNVEGVRQKQDEDKPSTTRVGAGARHVERDPERIIIRTPANRFDIDVNEIPEGMDYGWKAKYVRGALDRERWLTSMQNGWKPVPAGRHPSFTLAPPDSTEEIERGGLVLCERPIRVSKMAREMDRQAAVDQLQTQIDRLEGRARQTQSQRVTKLNTTYEAVTDES